MFKYCLNASTIKGYGLTLPQQVEVAAAAGYDALEPWIADMLAFVQTGGSLEALGGEARDRGLTIQGAIGFFEWIIDDDERRAKAWDVARRDLEMVAAFGGRLLAAPPSGAVEASGINLLRAAERYHALCELARPYGVRPLVEVWGFSRTLSRLGEAVFVAVESGHPSACVLADIYHLYKGGSPLEGLELLRAEALPLFHINDYPGAIAPVQITDADRVWPGVGDAPLGQAAELLRRIGFDGYLSLELFNPAYWQTTALETAKEGLARARHAFDAA